ncbi:Imm45 family immunity protein [Pararhizobium sp.]|uniref:Imm45 family immunity protein n=1 Tax=Pararhizobium sp. TaxID=1977563 RepID=UPI002717EB7D|nr:Imm45 family immunity protein [Pararhizobium sp.]MDO9415241.1 Imm45 family immunity protein [Pararhizobium sp.]
MPRLAGLDRDLHIGDILRLPENYDLGPGSAPVDLLVCETNDDGLGLIVVSGYKAGLVYAILPGASKAGESRVIAHGWLMENWDKWFCYGYQDGMRTIPMESAVILAWDQRDLRDLT